LREQGIQVLDHYEDLSFLDQAQGAINIFEGVDE